MRPIDTILIYVVIPVVVLLLLLAATTLRRSGRAARYRVGDDWPHDPVWWIGNPKGTHLPEPTVDAVGTTTTRTARGGARGTW
ncbi:hypothetical protein [Actinomycetospora sp. TBRC 11914]|uniref:aa3-type cytochrome oxidase subunit CtaJ n=1 Tax=Actinomycetospora sp. TBRC 11914 TaxID=2729387 RepID=UPI00145E7585|nr:hypothetical protein [Actinomycetospora sp. TBRC 11914]NMO91350.1 hypothetical protein [Actinomycetospora sp. TBRC 11914]